MKRVVLALLVIGLLVCTFGPAMAEDVGMVVVPTMETGIISPGPGPPATPVRALISDKAQPEEKTIIHDIGLSSDEPLPTGMGKTPTESTLNNHGPPTINSLFQDI